MIAQGGRPFLFLLRLLELAPTMLSVLDHAFHLLQLTASLVSQRHCVGMVWSKTPWEKRNWANAG